MSKTILVSATPIEHGGVKEINGYPIYQVGIGKINSAMNMMNLIHKFTPELVINFGSCGNLKDNKVGEVLEVGTVYNNIDARPFADYGVTPETNYSEIKLSNSDIKCFTTDQIYDNTRSDYAKKYLEMIDKCDIVDMECYSLAFTCSNFGVEFKSFKWISDDGNVDTWEENASIGFENFKNILNEKM